jgi:8-oxo-dGTP diphosphatase
MPAVRENERPFLDTYDASAYPPVAAAVDVVALTVRGDDLCALVVKRNEPPFEGSWALPGTFIQPDETADDAATRALAQKTGLTGHTEQLRTYTSPNRDPRMRVVSIAYLSFGIAGDSDDENVEWWPVSKIGIDFGGRLDKRQLAFDHTEIVWDGVERARSKLEYTTLAGQFLSEQFSIAELKHVYSVVWGRSIDAGNFYRKVKSSDGFLELVSDDRSAKGVRQYRLGKAKFLYPPIRRDPGWW